ncbi:MAG TPA: hypothetical protein PLQ13_12185 [Candidatus Krumholzibacteria bacterium]|nr:hypothetical protein [Candidatus Krumholzibacteria bacterium]
MKRTSIPVLLVVLTLLLATLAMHGTAVAADPAGAIARPDGGGDRHQADLIVNTDGTVGGDDDEGDPDTAGDTLGYRQTKDLLGASNCVEASAWAELFLKLMDCLVILR